MRLVSPTAREGRGIFFTRCPLPAIRFAGTRHTARHGQGTRPAGLSRGYPCCASSVICAFPIQRVHHSSGCRAAIAVVHAPSAVLFRYNAFATHPAVARLQVLSSVLCDTKRVRHSPCKAYAPCYQRRHADGGQPDSAGRQRNCGNKKPRTGRGWKGCAAISHFPGGSPGLSHGVWRCDHRQSRDRQS